MSLTDLTMVATTYSVSANGDNTTIIVP
jgi:hypothetical protein